MYVIILYKVEIWKKYLKGNNEDKKTSEKVFLGESLVKFSYKIRFNISLEL